MKKFLKYLAISFTVIIVLLLVIPFFVSLDSYKNIAAQKVKEITGRELKINGDITVALLPTPTIKVKSVSLSSVRGATTYSLLEVKEVSAALSLVSLLKGDINIATIDIYEPILNLERLPNGSASWELSASSNKLITDNNITEVNESKGLTSLYIGSIKILKGKINYYDAYSNKAKINTPTTLEVDNLEIKNLRGPLDVACQFYSSGKDYSIEGNIQEKQGIITFNSDLNIFKEKIIISGDLRRDDMSYNGKFKLEGNSKNLQDIFPAIKILSNADHQLTFNIAGDKKLLKMSEINFSSGKIFTVGDATLSLEDNKIDSKLKLNPGNIEFAVKSLKGNSKGFKEKIYITATALKPLFDELAIDIKDIPSSLLTKAFVFSSNVSYHNQDLFLHDLDLATEKASLKGDIGFKNWSKNMFITYDFKISELSAFANLFALNLPANLNHIAIKGEASKEKEKIKISNMLTFAKTAVNGNIDINLKASKPEISSDIKVTSLNLNELLSNSPVNNQIVKNNASSPSNVVNSTPWSKNKLDLSFLRKMDGNITLYIQNIIKGDLVFDTIKSTMSLSNGVLNIKSLSGRLYGGNLKATGRLSADKDQEVSFKVNLTGAELRNIIKQQGKIKVTKGNVNFTGDIKTSGHSQLQYISNLFGNVNLTAAEGNISGFDLQKILNALRNTKRLEDILGILEISFSGGETNFQNLMVAADIKEGIASITHAKLTAEATDVTAKGNIDLPKYSCDVEGLVTLDIKRSLPPFKVRFYGSLNNIQHQLDTKLLQQYLIKNVLTNVLKEGGEGRKPEEMLKNLIGIGKEEKSDEMSSDQDSSPEDKNPLKELKSIGKELKGLFK